MDSKVMIVILVIVFAADIIWHLYQNKKRDDILKKLDGFLARKDFASFDELVDSKLSRWLFPAYNIAFLKLNEALYMEDMGRIEKAFESFGMPMNKIQKEALYKKGFYYYLGLEDKEKTEYYLNQLKELDVKDMQTLDMMHDIYILKGYRYLDQINERINKLPLQEQMPFFALLSDMYRNKGDTDKADEYERMVSEYTEKLKG
ncbi:MAG: hypothetical protein IIZ80_09750 [Erysipelotrichaceae bacterium]|nr:hypothetical protein [Erysipelotrichaceae bacterium]